MLLEFGAKNFYSFKEGFEISLRLGQTCPQNISKNKDFVDILAIKGANASGKTNVIKVLGFLHSFVPNSFSDIKPDAKIAIDSFFDNDKPISLYAIFIEGNTEYKYELIFSKNKIIQETIERKNKRWTTIIKRDGNKITTTAADFQELKQIKINRSNASIVSIAHQHGLKSTENIYKLFDNIWANVSHFGRLENKDVLPDYEKTSKFYQYNPNILTFVVDFLKKTDTGIEDIKIHEVDNEQTNETEYFPIFYYLNKDHSLLLEEQSNGVKALYSQLGLYFSVLGVGAVLVLDAFDIHLHPDLLPMLLNLFKNKKTNPNNAQLIITTHNDTVMDTLSKYKTVLVNKDQNESFLYRLDEIPGDILRNDRPISPIYQTGKIGGKPKLANTA